MVAFGNLVKTIKTFRAHLDEAETDLKDFETAVQNFESELEAVGVELGQMAASTRDEEGKYIFRGLMEVEKVIHKQIADIRADTRITEKVALAMEDSLQELLHEQGRLLAAFSPSPKQ